MGHDHALVAHRPDQAVEAIAGRTCLIAKHDVLVLVRKPLHYTTHSSFICVELA